MNFVRVLTVEININVLRILHAHKGFRVGLLRPKDRPASCHVSKLITGKEQQSWKVFKLIYQQPHPRPPKSFRISSILHGMAQEMSITPEPPTFSGPFGFRRYVEEKAHCPPKNLFTHFPLISRRNIGLV